MTAPPSSNTTFLRHLYDAYRTARMNQLYYGWRLKGTQRWNRWLDVIIAVSSSTAIAGWGLMKRPGWELAWQVLGGLGALLAVVKPILDPGKQIERYGRLFAGHGDVYFDLHRLVEEVAESRATTPEHRARYEACFDRTRQLAPEDDPDPKPRILRRAFDQVIREVPAAQLWMPEKGAGP